MTSKERFSHMYAHREADRIPIIDSFWKGTINRWQREGLPRQVDFIDYLGLDHVAHINTDNSPRFETKLLEETELYSIWTTAWGATIKNWKNMDSTPEFLDFIIIDRDRWDKAKLRIKPSKDRIEWRQLRQNYSKWKKNGHWIQANLWFGFDVTHSWIVGTERFLAALIEDPEWCCDIFNHQLQTHLALLDMVWEAGYEFDCISWPDDMGYRAKQFFSLSMYRDILKPFHQRAIDWAHAKGIKAHLHSCGDVNPFVPELISMGLDALNPLEVKAGMDPIHLKKNFGDELVLHGGINALLWDHPQEIRAEIELLVPILKEKGGYIFSSDHSVPSTVSLAEFKEIISLTKRLGTY